MRHLIVAAVVAAGVGAAPRPGRVARVARGARRAAALRAVGAVDARDPVGGRRLPRLGARPTRRSSAAPGQAGYDGGFWIRGGSFLLKINLTLQTRCEDFDWDDTRAEAVAGRRPLGLLAPARDAEVLGRRDLRRPLLRRARVRPQRLVPRQRNGDRLDPGARRAASGGARPRPASSAAAGRTASLREGWIEYEAAPAGSVPHGPREDGDDAPAHDAARDAAVRRHLARVGVHRRDDAGLHGPQPRLRLHGPRRARLRRRVLSTWSTVTNGDGPVHRNVLDGTTNDNLAYSARASTGTSWVTWATRRARCARRRASGRRRRRLGALLRRRRDRTTPSRSTRTASRGAWTRRSARAASRCTAAYSTVDVGQRPTAATTSTARPGSCRSATSSRARPGRSRRATARTTTDVDGRRRSAATEIGVAVNYYIDGHADKVTLDVAFISADDDGNSSLRLCDDLVLYATTRRTGARATRTACWSVCSGSWRSSVRA